MQQSSPVEQAGKRLVFEDSVEVPAPVEEVYRRWSDFSSFPIFMSNVDEVQNLGDNRTHWVAHIFGVKQEWDAETTDLDPNRRIAWRSTSGPYNAGTVTFIPGGDGNTEVHLRLEYTPPGGKAGQVLEGITQTTRKEVKEDLRNFKRLVKGAQATIEGPSEMDQAGEGLGRVLVSLAPVAAGALAGGLTAYYMERNTRLAFSLAGARRVVRNPAVVMRTPAVMRAARNVGLDRPPAPFSAGVARPWSATGWGFAGLSAASVLGAATLRFAGRKNDALFVGQWAPTLLSMGVFSRVLGSRGITRVPAAITSWSLFGASVGAVLTSAFWRIMGKRKDALFVGQWAPTMLTAATIARFFRR